MFLLYPFKAVGCSVLKGEHALHRQPGWLGVHVCVLPDATTTGQDITVTCVPWHEFGHAGQVGGDEKGRPGGWW